MNKGQNVRHGRTRNTSKKGGIKNNSSAGNKVDSKSRGNPKQNLDKYLGMARDARQAGDRVNEEYYLQFAEHFQRVINERAVNDEERRARSPERNNQRGASEKNSKNSFRQEAVSSVSEANTEQSQEKKTMTVIDLDGTEQTELPLSDKTDEAGAVKPARRVMRRRKPAEKKLIENEKTPGVYVEENKAAE